ncbi:MAG: RNA polymerase sigma factor [Terriglobales bacterium]
MAGAQPPFTDSAWSGAPPAAHTDGMEEHAVWPVGDFEAAFRAHYRNLVSRVSALTGDRARAEEIAADAFWKLYQHPELLAPGNCIGGWLYRTAMRLGIDRLRSQARQQRTVAALRQEPGHPAGTPQSALEQRERVAQVRRALRRLRPQQARLLWLRHEGAPYREVAGALGVQPGSVGTLLARAEAAFAASWRARH